MRQHYGIVVSVFAVLFYIFVRYQLRIRDSDVFHRCLPLTYPRPRCTFCIPWSLVELFSWRGIRGPRQSSWLPE